METKFKTLLAPNGEFGALELMNNDTLFIGTSSKPHLYDSNITVKIINEQFKGVKIYGSNEKFDWDTEIPTWRLVEVTVTINK